MGEDDIVELLWKSGQLVRSSQTQSPSSDPPPILRGSGSGGREENAPLPLPPPLHHQNLFIQEDDMFSWLHHPLRQDYFCSELLDASTPATHPRSSVSLSPPPSAPYGQIIAPRRAEDFINFLRLRGNILSGDRVEAGSWFPVGSSATTSFSKIAEDRERKKREETIAGIQGTEDARGSTSRKRSRAAEMHNLSERRRREKINQKMKTLQELIPRCNKSNKASLLDDVIEYVKWLQSQIQMMSTGHGMMPPMMYAGNMQQFMPHMATGRMGMNRPPFIPFPGTPFPRPHHIAGLGPPYPAPRYSFPNIQTSDSSRVHLPTPQPNPVLNQPQFPAYLNPYSQFVGLHQMQQPPPPLQSQTTSQLNFSQASSSKELEDPDNQPTG